MKIRVKVTPSSKSEGVTREGDCFVVKVKEPPREGKANKTVVKLLAEYFGVSRRQVVISSGFKSRNKVVEFQVD